MPEPLTLVVTRPPGLEVLCWRLLSSLACDSHNWEGGGILFRPGPGLYCKYESKWMGVAEAGTFLCFPKCFVSTHP